jgi:hypothetical protein
MSLFEMLSVNNSNRGSQDFDGQFLVEEERAARKNPSSKVKPQANTAIGICRRSRTSSNLPVSINGRKGVTRDISSSGVYVVQSSQHEVGSKIDCLIDLDTSEGKLKLCCEGIVVRVEEVDGRFGIGVKILSQTTMHYN